MCSHFSRLAEKNVFGRGALIFCMLVLLQPLDSRAEPGEVLIGLTAELQHSTSAAGQSIRAGIRAAIADINASGGVLSGRSLQLVEREDRGLPARGLDNFRELAAMPAMAGVFAGGSARFSNELVKAADSLKTPILIPWVGAEPLQSGESPSKYVFRLAITERGSLALMFQEMRQRRQKRIGLMLPSNVWGRRVAREAVALVKSGDSLNLMEPQWYEAGSATLIPAYKAALERAADALVLIMNENDWGRLMGELAATPEIPRLPLYLHWTALGGKSSPVPSAAPIRVDLNVVQVRLPDSRHSMGVLERIARQLPESFSGKVLVSSAALQAYDLTRLLALAIARSETGNRVDIRNRLLALGDYSGVMRQYRNPYPGNGPDALTVSDFGIFRLLGDGTLEASNSVARR